MTSNFNPDQLPDEGKNDFTARHFEDAIKKYEGVLEREPDNLRAMEGLARSLMRNKREREALKVCNRALALNKELAIFHYLIGAIHNHLGDQERGESEVSRALELDPNLIDAQVTLGMIRVQSGRIGEGVSSYTKALSIDPNNVYALVNLGIALARLDRYHEATQAIWQAFRASPSVRTVRMLFVALHSEHVWIAPLVFIGISIASLFFADGYTGFITMFCAASLGVLGLGAYQVQRTVLAAGYILGMILILVLYFTLVR